jgi:hypothetical protein
MELLAKPSEDFIVFLNRILRVPVRVMSADPLTPILLAAVVGLAISALSGGS